MRRPPFLPAVRLSLFVAALALLSPTRPAHAADLVQSWQAARAVDPTYAAARGALQAALEKIPQGDALLASRVDLTADASQARQDYHSGRVAVQPGAIGDGQQLGAALAWTKPLYDVASEVARDRLHQEAEQARLVWAQADQDLVLRVARAYLDVLLARDRLQLAQAQKQAVEIQLGLARKSYELGVSPVTDADDAQARYDNIVAAQQLDATDLETKSAAFVDLTGLPANAVRDIAPTLLGAAPEPASLAALVARAPVDNLVVRQLEAGVRIARRAIDQYRAEASPVVSVVASYGQRIDNGSISQSGGRDRTGNAALGLQLSVPLFDGGLRRSQQRQAVAQAESQADGLDAARRDARRLAQAYAAAVRDGALRIAALDRALVSGASSVQSNTTGREVGVRTTIDVLNAEQAWYQTLYDLSAARVDFLFNRLQLAAEAGALDDAVLREVNACITP